MRRFHHHLLNTSDIEVWPAQLLRARGNHDARLLARATAVLRRKRDGLYLAAEIPEGLMPLTPRLAREAGIDDALEALAQFHEPVRDGLDVVASLPLHRLQERLAQLEIDADAYAARTGLALVAEPAWLAFAGFDRYRRALWLQVDAANAWQHMRDAALRDGIVLEPISGYRSHDYQSAIFERKRARGLSIKDILTVNAAPGYSEHHGGHALDISTTDEPAAEASFEDTAAFAWLGDHAASHGFAMSYPRGNPHGIVYEPWHWRWSARHDD